MTVLINEKTKIIIQGFTGKIGSFHASEMIKYGTKVVGGVTPGKGGQKHLGLPVFNTVKEAVKKTGATASILFVPPAFAADSAMEAADGGIKVCVAITDGIPSHDIIKVKRYMRRYSKKDKMTLIGPNCAGVISPGKAMLGIMPGHIYLEGKVGSKITIERILYLDDGKNKMVGDPLVKVFRIDGEIEPHGRERKVVVFKFKRRKGYQKKNTHRQEFSMLKVGKIKKAVSKDNTTKTSDPKTTGKKNGSPKKAAPKKVAPKKTAVKKPAIKKTAAKPEETKE